MESRNIGVYRPISQGTVNLEMLAWVYSNVQYYRHNYVENLLLCI